MIHKLATVVVVHISIFCNLSKFKSALQLHISKVTSYLSVFLLFFSSSFIASASQSVIDLGLTVNEIKWLKEHPVVTFTGDPNWLPYEAFDVDGHYIGIVSEHLKIISDMTGIEFKMSPSETWTESTNKAKLGEVDVLSETDDSDLKSHLNFTTPYVANPIVIVMKNTENYVEEISVIKNKKIALIKDYGYAAKIRRKYSDIEFITVDDIQDGLISVSTGEIDALLCTLALCSYTISELGLNNVKITGKTEFDTKLAFGVQKNLHELLSILNKAINKISVEEHQVILDGWIKDKFVDNVDYSLVYKILFSALLLLLLFAFWVRRLSSEIKLRNIAENKLKESRKRYQTLFDKTADALLIIEDNKFVDCNDATLIMLGYTTKNEILDIHPSELSPEFQPDGELSENKANLMIETAFAEGSHRFEWNHVRKNGEVFPVEVLLTLIPFENTKALHVVWRDITERKKSEKEIERQIYYDSLTELPNRKLLLERLEQALITSRRHKHFGALLFVDLDRFKAINDSFGHSIGDQLLIESAKIIKSCVWDEDTVSRFGGDEYIVLLRHVGNESDEAALTAKKVATKIKNAFNKPFIIRGNEMHTTSSIGIALFPHQDEGVENIIKHADTAMYSAKQAGRNQIAFYLSEMHDKVIKRSMLEKDLRQAINDNKLNVFYQPLVDDNGNIIAVEALIRWLHPKHGYIDPEEFILIAEDTGLIYDIGNFVCHTALTDIITFNKENNSLLKLSINISPRQFRKSNFVDIIKSLFESHKINKGFLTLEVTEHIAIDNLNDAIEKFEQLQQVGVRLSLDDFGTGYSSLSHLKRLPIDELKIDKSFVFDIETDPQDALLVKSIINIAKQFDLKIVAEGVETQEQLDFLRREGCNVYQGYIFSEALSIEKLTEYLNNR